MKKLVNWQKDNPVIHDGKLMHFAPRNDGIYTYFRYNEQKTVMVIVILNKSEDEIELHRDYYSEMLNGFSSGTDVITGNKYSLDNLVVPESSSLILELE